MNSTRLAKVLFALLVSSTPVLAQLQLAPLTSFGTNGDGTVRPGDVWFLDSTGSRYQRGMAYNPTTGHLLVVNRDPTGSETIDIMDAATGSDLTLALDQSARTLGGRTEFPYNMIAVADDGAIYVGNLTTSSAAVEFILYRWENETALQTRVYGPANPAGALAGNARWGDAIAVRGTGPNTEVLICNNGNIASILKPADSTMTAFTATPLLADVSSPIPFGAALAFGPGNTFYAKAAGDPAPLFLMSYNTSAGTATTIASYDALTFPGRVGAIGLDLTNHLLFGLEFTTSTQPDIVRLYSISNAPAAPVLLDRRAVDVMTNANSIFAGAIALNGTNVYALDADNGIVAFSVSPGTDLLPARIYDSPIDQIVQITSNVVMTVGVDGTPALYYQWQFNGADIPGATTNQLLLTGVGRTNQGSYSVWVTNLYGASTSSVANLTVLEGYGNLLVYEPFNYAVGSGLVGQGGWINGGTQTGPGFYIEADNLSLPYHSPSLGNQVVLDQNASPRKPIGTYTKGVLYYSFFFRLETITARSSETTVAFATGTSTTYTAKFNVATNGNDLDTYTVGIYKGSGTGNGAVATNADGTPMLFTTNDTLFIVGRYVFNSTTTTDDTMDLWVNPDPSTFGAKNPPPPTVGPIGAGAGDATQIDHFVLRWSSGFNRRHIDEARIGFAWAEVTPVARPKLDYVRVGSNLKLLWPTNISSGFVLNSLQNVQDNDWQPVTTPAIVIEGSSNTVTVPTTGHKFFRLQK